MNPAYVWWLIGIFLFLGEVLLPGLTVFFFGLGAVLVGFLCLLSPTVASSINVQLLIFVVVSLGALLGLRRWMVNVFKGRLGGPSDAMPDEVVGKRVRVIAAINPPYAGQVEFHGVSWSAEADVAMDEGAMAEITARDGLTLHVQPLRKDNMTSIGDGK